MAFISEREEAPSSCRIKRGGMNVPSMTSGDAVIGDRKKSRDGVWNRCLHLWTHFCAFRRGSRPGGSIFPADSVGAYIHLFCDWLELWCGGSSPV